MEPDVPVFQKVVAQLIEPKVKKVDESKFTCRQYLSGMLRSSFQDDEELNDLWVSGE